MARNILVVEDDNNISNLIKMYLDKEGFDVRIAADGGKAVEEFKEKEPDLVLLDVMLPGTDGIELLRRLRASARFAELPVVMATAKGAEYDKIQGLDLGADYYLTKPFGVMEFVSCVKAVLRRSRPKTAQALLRSGTLTLDPLMEKVWGVDYCGETRTVDMHIRTLRQKLGENGEHIETVRGVGYRWEAEKN